MICGCFPRKFVPERAATSTAVHLRSRDLGDVEGFPDRVWHAICHYSRWREESSARTLLAVLVAGVPFRKRGAPFFIPTRKTEVWRRNLPAGERFPRDRHRAPRARPSRQSPSVEAASIGRHGQGDTVKATRPRRHGQGDTAKATRPKRHGQSPTDQAPPNAQSRGTVQASLRSAWPFTGPSEQSARQMRTERYPNPAVPADRIATYNGRSCLRGCRGIRKIANYASHGAVFVVE